MGIVARLFKWLFIALIALALLIGLGLFATRFADGPLGPVAGGPFATGQLHTGPEPDWSAVKDRQEVEFALLDPARSRTTWIMTHNNRIFIPSGYMGTTIGKLWKQWPIEAEQDGRAVLRVDDDLYERKLVRIKDDPDLDPVLDELARKYLAPAGTDRAPYVAGARAQIASGNLWLFELTPRS